MKKILVFLLLFGCGNKDPIIGEGFSSGGSDNPTPTNNAACYTDNPNSIFNLWHNVSEDMTLDFRDGILGAVDYYGIPLTIKFTLYPHGFIRIQDYGRDTTGLVTFNKYECDYDYEIITQPPSGLLPSTETQGFFRLANVDRDSPEGFNIYLGNDPQHNVCLEMVGKPMAGGWGYNYYNWHTYTVVNKKLNVRFFEGVSVNHPPIEFDLVCEER